ncbi:MAG: hypothetical protein AB9921_11355 [Erysipelotrichaceae bacterium]
MPSNLKSIILNLGLILIILLIVLFNLFVFVSGPAQKISAERERALVRVEGSFGIADAVSLYDSDYNQSLFIGEGTENGVEVYFAATLNGNVLDTITKAEFDFDAALVKAGQEIEFIDPEVRVAYYKGKFVIAVLETNRETLLDRLEYSVVFTVEINV